MTKVRTAEIVKGANSIDVHVGARIRLQRAILGMTLENLGAALGLTFQQVQKCESGVNRIGASRLFEIARVLDVPITFFFEELSENIHPSADKGEHSAKGFTEGQERLQDERLQRRETLVLVRAYYRITEPAVRMRVLDLIKGLTADG
ncbi:helix-turn-helix domain-containing protein [Muricoccus radiodurans]|uniref:helix-turn-helix domain-containing protein n=1 Tax=Muricoccus radiodurans TaxID=2231721 RepID=UPI003CF6D2AC